LPENVRRNHPQSVFSTPTIAFIEFDELDERLGNQRDRKPKSMNFFSKFIQLQDLMFAHNAGLTASHPYASSPNSWPFAKKGISFWTENDTHKQIYLVGNLVGWWTSAGAVFLIFGIFPASIFAERRNIPVLSDCESSGLQDCS
jgi:dolichyl-phosphate-mannose-protein mannosyltransferase